MRDLTSSLTKFALIVTSHETSQNSLRLTEVGHDDWPALVALVESWYPEGRWLTPSLYSDESCFLTVLTGYGPCLVTATSRDHLGPA